MPTQPFPTTPNLDHLKKQAKQLVKDNKEGQVDAFSSIKAPFPRLEQARICNSWWMQGLSEKILDCNVFNTTAWPPSARQLY